jgi:hypothetical protein
MKRSQLIADCSQPSFHVILFQAEHDMPGETVEHTAAGSEGGIIVRTHDERDLDRIADDQVQAVIYTPSRQPSWLGELAAAVERGSFLLPRTVLQRASRDEVAGWLAAHLPEGGIAPDVQDALFDDILGLIDRLATSARASRFMMRIFTAAPSTECGFHVDTVPPGAPTWGLLRVYNGPGTEFVEPGNVTSMAEFYRYLSRRERFERERREARVRGDTAAYEQLNRDIAELDSARSFLLRPHEIFVAAAGAIVAFKHIDVRFHWESHGKERAWIHCSPMKGPPRLVVNVTSPEAALRRAR